MNKIKTHEQKMQKLHDGLTRHRHQRTLVMASLWIMGEKKKKTVEIDLYKNARMKKMQDTRLNQAG